uniref:Uncharacterized protein n=1 Tax=Oncorhynchus tshawytscha TaxID=74940 RepID=A0A8C8K787_ONCTS
MFHTHKSLFLLRFVQKCVYIPVSEHFIICQDKRYDTSTLLNLSVLWCPSIYPRGQGMYNLLAQVTGRKRVMVYSPQDTLHLNLTGDKSEGLAIDCSDLGWFPEFVKAWWYWFIVHELHQFNIVPVSPSDLCFHNTMALQFGMGVNIFWCHLPAEGYNKNDPYGKNQGHLHTVAKHFKPMATELK